MKKQCFICTEGGPDRKFYQEMVSVRKFKYHISGWEIAFGNDSGRSPEDILEACVDKTRNKVFNNIICIIDLDIIKKQHKKGYEKYCKKLENKYKKIKIL
jgi:hypothetical protein